MQIIIRKKLISLNIFIWKMKIPTIESVKLKKFPHPNVEWQWAWRPNFIIQVLKNNGESFSNCTDLFILSMLIICTTIYFMQSSKHSNLNY